MAGYRCTYQFSDIFPEKGVPRTCCHGFLGIFVSHRRVRDCHRCVGVDIGVDRVEFRSSWLEI